MGKSDIIVFASHPDDEAFGCAGLIYTAVQKEKKVKVIEVTNGESSIEGTKLYYGYKPETQDYINIGLVRQKESISAMNVLGLTSDDIIFLGYPDNGLMDMISKEKYSKSTPYHSRLTDFDKVSYENSLTIGAPFCRDSFFSDIKNILDEYKPKEIYVNHPLDSHLDHRACGNNIYNIAQNFDDSIRIFGYILSKSKIPSPKQRFLYKCTGQLKEKYLKEGIKEIKMLCIKKYKSQRYLFDQLTFHIEIERFWKLKPGVRARLIKKIEPRLKF